MSATPIATRRTVLEMKYGKIMRANPQISGTTAFCFLPYMKKPSPTEPKSKPQRSQDVFNAISRMTNDYHQSRYKGPLKVSASFSIAHEFLLCTPILKIRKHFEADTIY